MSNLSEAINKKSAGSDEKQKTMPIVIMLVLIYVIVAMSDNFKGIFVPFFKEEFQVNNTQIGYVMTASLFAYAVFQYIGGILIEKFGYKRILSFGFLLGILSLLILITCPNFTILIIGMFLLNTGMAMFNIGVNTLGPALPVASTAVLMNIINCSYGAGNTVIQKVTGDLLSKGIPWRSFFIFMLIASGLLFLYLILTKIPFEPVIKKSKGKKSYIFKNPLLYLYIAICGFYLASEYGIGNWFVNYMNETFQLSSDKSAFYVSLFFGSKTIGLLFGGFIADKLGHFRCILVYGIAASITSFAGIAMGQNGLFIFAIGGLAFSAIFPTVITTIGGSFHEDTSYVTGLILMCGTLIAMIISMLIGVLNDIAGADKAFYMIAAAIAFTTLFSQILHKYIKKLV